MELANAALDLWSRKWLVLLVALLSAAIGVLLAFDVSFSPFSLERKGLQVGTASTQVFVDTRDPAVDSVALTNDPYKDAALIQRAHTIARLTPSAEIRRRIATIMDVEPEDIAVTPPTDPATTGTRPETTSSQRALALVSASSEYQVTVADSSQAPTIDISTQTTDPAKAGPLASAVVTALQGYPSSLRRTGYVRPVRRKRSGKRTVTQREAARARVVAKLRREVTVRSTGAPFAGTITSGANVQLAVAGAVGSFLFGCLLILGFTGMGRGIAEAQRRREIAPPDRGQRLDLAPPGPQLPAASLAAAQVEAGER